MWVSLCNIAGPLSENRSQVGLSSTTHARFRRKTYQKKMCCVPFLFCHFPKAWSPYNADNHSHDTVLKIAEIQPQVVNTQSGEHSPKIVILLNRMNFVLCSQESLAADGCLDLHTAEFRSIRKKYEKNWTLLHFFRSRNTRPHDSTHTKGHADTLQSPLKSETAFIWETMYTALLPTVSPGPITVLERDSWHPHFNVNSNEEAERNSHIFSLLTGLCPDKTVVDRLTQI